MEVDGIVNGEKSLIRQGIGRITAASAYSEVSDEVRSNPLVLDSYKKKLNSLCENYYGDSDDAIDPPLKKMRRIYSAHDYSLEPYEIISNIIGEDGETRMEVFK
jgi:hypothetical protein